MGPFVYYLVTDHANLLLVMSTFDIYLLSAFCYLYLDADVRLARRIRRDTVERGRDVNSVLEQV